MSVFKQHHLITSLLKKLHLYYNVTHKRLCSSSTVNLKLYELESLTIDRIRNFSIVAHVDHGKSTLADRLLEVTGAIKRGESQQQVLDRLQVEKERGITVKAVTASLNFSHKRTKYLLNLIDTPGHVDFSNEVVRSVQACQGAILVVDANEGPQAQTVAVYSLAKKQGLTVIPVLNKIDLPNADPEKCKKQLKTLFDIDPNDVIEVSAKKGWGVDKLLEAIIERIPHPPGYKEHSLKALVFDSWYDRYRGAMSVVYIQDGVINVGDAVRWWGQPKPTAIKYMSLLTPEELSIEQAIAGQVVAVGCGPRNSGSVGNLLMSSSEHYNEAIEKKQTEGLRHMVFAGLYPVDQSQNVSLRMALEKLCMNDPAVSLTVDSSPALGQGWRVGFLGLLHLEVFTQRLFQEHKAEVVLTAPSVPYKVKIIGAKNIKAYGSEIVTITNPALLPDPSIIEEYYEPFIIGTIITPIKYVDIVTKLCLDRRGKLLPSIPMDDKNLMMQFSLPLCEVVIDFHDTLKSVTSGYASFDYQDDGYHESPLAKLSILLNGKEVDELCTIVHASRSRVVGRKMVEKLKEMIPRQMVLIAIQASVQGKVVARENIPAFRKDVTAKLYGGDVTRRNKLLKQQAEGKKKMRAIANIEVPRNTFIDVLKR